MLASEAKQLLARLRRSPTRQKAAITCMLQFLSTSRSRSLSTLIMHTARCLLFVARFYSRAYFRKAKLSTEQETQKLQQNVSIFLNCDLHCAIAFLI